uniref:Dihydrolipoamide acetyltransferase component of pyruvate dehydrogenase complex n=1 Tax=Fagus sylvatica TaxID=28930 RepID=A0A2N9HFF2_FAGSY
MWPILRRKVATQASSSAYVFGRSTRGYTTKVKEALLVGRGSKIVDVGRNSFLGSPVSSKPVREVVSFLQRDSPLYMQYRSFSSDNGDLVEAVVPFMGESITDGTLATFLKQPGDRVEVDEPIAQIETDKVTIDVASPEAGVIQKFVAKEGDTVEPGTKIAVISKSAEGVAHVAPSENVSSKAASKPSAGKKKADKEKPTEETSLPKPKTETSPPKPKAPSPPPPKPSATEPQLPPKERERRVPMTRLRKRVATRLKDSQNTFAMLTTFNEVDMTNLMKLRSDYKDAFVEKHGVKLGLMSGFIKAAVSGIQNQPIINAVIDGDDIIYRDYIDISIAVDDSLLFSKATANACEKIQGILAQYEQASGQQVNRDKTTIYFSKHTPEASQNVIKAALGVPIIWQYEKYLGLPSLAGREILIKAVAQAIPTYSMSCFRLPTKLCNELEATVRRFWWSNNSEQRKIHWVAWRKLCQPKQKGGMGFRDLRKFNDTLLAKQMEWDHSLIDSLFIPHDAEAIKHIPLSNREHADKLTWPGNTNGEYSVRSGYRFLVDEEDKSLPASCEALTTKLNLHKRRIPVDPICEICGELNENAIHALWSCKHLQLVWEKEAWLQSIRSTPFVDFADLLTKVLHHGRDSEPEIFITLCWALWQRRNKIRLHQEVDPINQQTPITTSLGSEMDATENAQVQSQLYDGAVFKETNAAGIGIIVRDSSGLVIASLVQKVRFPHSIPSIEAWAAKRSIQFALEIGLPEAEFEDAKVLARKLQQFSFSHVKRQGNRLAHALARKAQFCNSLEVWMEAVPPDLELLYLSSLNFS